MFKNTYLHLFSSRAVRVQQEINSKWKSNKIAAVTSNNSDTILVAIAVLIVENKYLKNKQHVCKHRCVTLLEQKLQTFVLTNSLWPLVTVTFSIGNNKGVVHWVLITSNNSECFMPNAVYVYQ